MGQERRDGKMFERRKLGHPCCGRRWFPTRNQH